jgi:nitrate reductase beta subunit
VHVPRTFTSQMFGPGVEQAIATYRSAPTDKELLSALLLFGSTPKTIPRFKVDGKEAVGLDMDGNELTRVPHDEPFFTRPMFDKEKKVYRLNVT